MVNTWEGGGCSLGNQKHKSRKNVPFARVSIPIFLQPSLATPLLLKYIFRIFSNYLEFELFYKTSRYYQKTCLWKIIIMKAKDINWGHSLITLRRTMTF